MRFVRAVSVTLLTKALGICFGVLTSVIVARYLGPSGRGVLTVLMALLGGAIQFGSLGLNGSILFYASKEKTNLEHILGNILVATSIMSMAIALLYFLLGEFSPSVLIGEVDVLYLHLVLIAIPFGFLSQFGQSLLVARQHIIDFNVLDLFSRFLMFGGFALVLIVLNFGTWEAAVCFITVTLITGTVYLARLSHYVKIRFRLARELVFPMLKYGMKAYLGSLLLFFVMRINIFVVNSLLGEYEVGLYSIPIQFLDVISLLPMTLGMLLFPKVAADDNDNGLLTAKVFRATFLLLMVICILTALAGPLLVEFLFGSDFLGSVEPLIWLTPGMLFLSLWMILNNDLAARGMPNIVMIAPAVALVGNLGVTLLLLDEFGITSAAIGLSVASFIGFTLVFAHFIRTLHIRVTEMLIFTKADFRSIFFRASDSSA